MKLSVLAVGCLVVALAACETVRTTSPGAVDVDRKQRMFSAVSEEQLNESAALAYKRELEQAAQRGELNVNEAQVGRVRQIAQKLIQETGVFRPDARSWNWEVNVRRSKEMNAYVMPGGKIMVYSGLIDNLGLSDQEIAAVIGHEIAHALREHTRERLSRAQGQQLALSIGAAVLGIDRSAAQLANAVADVTLQLPHSREQETEADRMGLELMARAGYDPRAAVAVWQKMSRASQGAPPEFLSTHPSNESRIREIEAMLERVLPLYQSSTQ